jgi:hypothetical protein
MKEVTPRILPFCGREISSTSRFPGYALSDLTKKFGEIAAME